MPTVPASKVPRRRTPAAAGVLSVAVFLGTVLSGCAYEYSADHWDDESTSAAAPPTTDAALPQDPHLNEPVTGEEILDLVAVDRLTPVKAKLSADGRYPSQDAQAHPIHRRYRTIIDRLSTDIEGLVLEC